MKKSFSNQEVVRLLREVAAAKIVTGDNRFAIRAYDTAADSIEHLSSPVKTLWQKQKLTEIPGVGANIASHLDELFSGSKSKHFEQEKKKVPAGMFPLLDIPEIGPKTAFKLAKELKLTKEDSALSKLKRAAVSGQIAKIEGMGEKTQKQILTAVRANSSKSESRLRIDLAQTLADEIMEYIKKNEAVEEISTLGSLRRKRSTIGDVDLGVATKQPEKVMAYIKKFDGAEKIIAAGPGLVRFRHESGQGVDVKIVQPREWGALLQHFTGGKAHNIALREYALKKAMSLSEHGIKKKDKLDYYPTEEKFYAALGMEWIPPELREDSGEIEAALRSATGKPNGLPNLVKLKDIKGDFHTHTDYEWKSSHDAGASSPQEMLQKAIKLGYEYVALGDHNPSVSSYSKQRLISEIRNRTQKLRGLKLRSGEKRVKNRSINVLVSLEVDIQPNGELAIPMEAISEIDFMVVSVHSSMNMNKEAMTERVVKAMAAPKAKILGHPTGSLINKRSGFELDWEEIFKACNKYKVALEINANPARLDIDELVVREAIKQGVKLVIDSDAHAAEHLELMRYGVSVARRGWAEKSEVVNAWPWQKARTWLGV